MLGKRSPHGLCALEPGKGDYQSIWLYVWRENVQIQFSPVEFDRGYGMDLGGSENFHAVEAGIFLIELRADDIGELSWCEGIHGDRPDFAQDFTCGWCVAELQC